jgi:hypothetical protein
VQCITDIFQSLQRSPNVSLHNMAEHRACDSSMAFIRYARVQKIRDQVSKVYVYKAALREEEPDLGCKGTCMYHLRSQSVTIKACRFNAISSALRRFCRNQTSRLEQNVGIW